MSPIIHFMCLFYGEMKLIAWFSPYNIIRKNIDEGIVTPDRFRKYKVEVTKSDGNYFLGKSRSENITYYKNRWDIK
jgi:hypothetical protein